MRSHTAGEPAVGFAGDAPAGLSPHAWEALPLPVRVQSRLAELVVGVDELRAELRHDSGALRWLDAETERIAETFDRLLERLVS